MVSGLPAGARAARALALPGSIALFALVSWLASCSKSECLRADCQTEGPASAGAAGTAVVPKCSASSDCDQSKGESCVDSACRLPCHSHFDCQGFGECVSGTTSEKSSVHYCDLSHPQKPGQFYTHCPNGDSDCDGAHGFLCVGAGSDDLDAYCSLDCSADSDCADGYICGQLSRSPCADDNSCGLTGVPKDHQCIASDQIGVGKPYQCGARSVTRNLCRPRKFCNTCTTDTDCLAVTDQLCAADKSGTKICTQLCDPGHPSCPWGSATSCGVYDTDLGQATCAHRFGQCTGTGKSCEPCLKDADCGSKGACTASEFTGEHWCVDLSVTCSCVGLTSPGGVCTGGGCPMTPGGLSMQCFDTDMTGKSGVCNGANTVNGLLGGGSPQTGCWPAK
jgi:hypothetical protein